MPGQRHKNLQADPMASRECSEGFLGGQHSSPRLCYGHCSDGARGGCRRVS